MAWWPRPWGKLLGISVSLSTSFSQWKRSVDFSICHPFPHYSPQRALLELKTSLKSAFWMGVFIPFLLPSFSVIIFFGGGVLLKDFPYSQENFLAVF
jgi:hypothetical protein